MQEITIDGLPKAGEPLQPYIDDDNQQLLELSVQDRIKRQQSRLTRTQRFFLTRRWRWLQHQLNKAGYNQLILDRWTCHQRYTELDYLLRNNPSKALRQEYLDTIKRGNQLNQQLDMLDLLITEFDQVNNKLQAHRELIAWEKEDRENFRAFMKEARTWQNQLIAAFKQSPRLHHRYVDRNGKEIIDIPKIKEIIVKDDEIQYQIKTTSQNIFERWWGRWHSALPYGVDVTSLTSDETLHNLSTICNRVVTVKRSKRGTNLYYCISRLDSSDGIPEKVMYQKVIDWYPAVDHHKTVWCAGVTNDRQVLFYNFEDIPHVLIAGATQGGKSNHVNQMIDTLATMNTPNEVRLLLVDLKGGIEFTHWRGLQHLLKPMLTTTHDVLDGLRYLRNIMEKRLQLFETVKAKNLASYNEKVETRLPRIICFIDEMATLIGLGDLTNQLHGEMRVLSAQGRAVGVHLVLCTQHSSVDVLPGWVKTNMSMRISAKMPSHQASMVILDSVNAALLPPIPGRLIFSTGRNETIAQSPFISDERIAQAIQLANQFPKPDNREFDESLPSIVPDEKFTRDDIMEFALEMNGKISANRIHDIVGNEVITLRKLRAMVHQLIDELERGNICYKGIEYTIERNRKAVILKPVGHSIEHKNGNVQIAI